MSMPAVAAYRKARPLSEIAVLVKPEMAPLWRLCASVDRVMVMERGVGGVCRAAGAAGRDGFIQAFVFPNSFRSALVPFLARIPRRRGARGHARSWMLTDLAGPPKAKGSHQAWEYYSIMNLHRRHVLDRPDLVIPSIEGSVLERELGEKSREPLVGMIPGAAYGPAKMWPAERFIETGRKIRDSHDATICVFGSPSEKATCSLVAREIGSGAIDLSGRTSLPELAAGLSRCRTVLCNDSGGMHLAAAVGTRVVAVFGITDPCKTGPMGDGHRVLKASGAQGSRDIPRRSREAYESLKSIASDEAWRALTTILKGETTKAQ